MQNAECRPDRRSAADGVRQAIGVGACEHCLHFDF
jgi:hypothetical protein